MIISVHSYISIYSYTVWVPDAARKGKKLTIRISTALGKGYGNGPEVKKVIKVK